MNLLPPCPDVVDAEFYHLQPTFSLNDWFKSFLPNLSDFRHNDAALQNEANLDYDSWLLDILNS